MKRFLSLLLCLALIAALAGCGSNNNSSDAATPTPANSTSENATPTPGSDNPSDPTATPTDAPKERAQVNVAVLKGPTAIGMLKLMSDDEAGTSANTTTSPSRARQTASWLP